MNSKTQRALSILDRLQKATGLSDTGRSALIQLLNPFTDFEFPTAGYFDTDESASIVQCVKFSAPIGAPPGVAGNWDCNIMSLPLAHINSVYVNEAYGNNFVTQSGSALLTASFGPVMCFAGAAGAELSLVQPNALPATTAVTCLGPPQPIQNQLTYTTGKSRVIGFGFEVHNTTAEIYQQGSVAVYRMPQPDISNFYSATVLGYTGTVQSPSAYNYRGTLNCYPFWAPPSNLADALLYAGTRQWKAAEGVMCVPTLINTDLPVAGTNSLLPVMIDGPETIPSWNVGYMYGAAVPQITSIGFTNGTVTINSSYTTTKTRLSNFNTSGAVFTGLSNQTTLTVNVIMYIERFPDHDQETDLVVLARPSPKYDPVARALYSLVLQELPVGVKVCDNADGDWFLDVMSTLGKIVSPAIRFMGPIGAASSGLIDVLTQTYDDSKKKKSRRLANDSGSNWTMIDQNPNREQQLSPYDPRMRPLPAIPSLPAQKTVVLPRKAARRGRAKIRRDAQGNVLPRNR